MGHAVTEQAEGHEGEPVELRLWVGGAREKLMIWLHQIVEKSCSVVLLFRYHYPGKIMGHAVREQAEGHEGELAELHSWVGGAREKLMTWLH